MQVGMVEIQPRMRKWRRFAKKKCLVPGSAKAGESRERRYTSSKTCKKGRVVQGYLYLLSYCPRTWNIQDGGRKFYLVRVSFNIWSSLPGKGTLPISTQYE